MLDISVVIETFNASPDSTIQLRDILRRLGEQRDADAIAEVIVVAAGPEAHLFEGIASDRPEVRVIEVEEPTYYSMKYHGIQAAHGDIVALLDSDCLPDPGWASGILSSIREGAVAVAGKTRYSDNKRFWRTFSFFSFGHVHNDADGCANTFIPNNAAFRREAIRDRAFDPRRWRFCGAPLITRQIKADGGRLVYNPDVAVTHHNYGLKYHLSNRARASHDAIMMSRWDDEDILPESRYKPLGIGMPFAFAARCLVHDCRRLFSSPEDLGITRSEIPYFMIVSLMVRTTEIVPGVITVLWPHFFRDRYEW